MELILQTIDSPVTALQSTVTSKLLSISHIVVVVELGVVSDRTTGSCVAQTTVDKVELSVGSEDLECNITVTLRIQILTGPLLMKPWRLAMAWACSIPGLLVWTKKWLV